MATPLNNLGHDAIKAKGSFGAHKWLILRRVTQLGILALFMLGPWTGFYILKGNMASSLIFDTVPLSDPLLFLQMLAAGFLGVSTTVIIGAITVALFYLIVCGRVYCAWVCPTNIVTDTAHWSRRKLGIRSNSRLKSSTRYWMLAMTLILSAATGTLAYELINPVSVVYRGLIFGMGFGWAVLVGIYLFDLLVAKHGWCGHLPVPGRGVLQPYRAGQSGACTRRCPRSMRRLHGMLRGLPGATGHPPALKSSGKGDSPVILSGACTNCARCVDICPHDVFAFGLRIRPATPVSKIPEYPRSPESHLNRNCEEENKIA